jgi:hypothetical protein
VDGLLLEGQLLLRLLLWLLLLVWWLPRRHADGPDKPPSRLPCARGHTDTHVMM